MEGRITRVLQSFRQQLGPGSLVFAAMQIVEQISNENKITSVQKASLWQQLLPQITSVAVQLGVLNASQANDLMQVIQGGMAMLVDIREAIIVASKLPQLVQTIETEITGCCKKK